MQHLRKTIVIGVGNILFYDEGTGVYAAAYLKENYTFSPDIEIIDGGTLGVRLSEYFLEYDEVLICDTVSIDDDAGSVYILDDKALSGLGTTAQSVHEIEVTQMIESCKMFGECAEVTIIGIVPEDIEPIAFGLSESVQEAFPRMMESIVVTLEDKGIRVHKKEDVTPLPVVLTGYANPTAPRE